MNYLEWVNRHLHKNIDSTQKLPYLFGGVFIATTASLPIGVSNIANLIGLGIVGLDLNSYSAMIFVPSMIGISLLSLLLFTYFKKDIPEKIASLKDVPFNHIITEKDKFHHPFSNNKTFTVDWALFRICIAIVILIRGSYFIFSPLGIHIEWIAILGAVLLIIIRWVRIGIGPHDLLKKAPWHILVFAFGMYVLVYALNNTGMTTFLINMIKEPVSSSLVNASFIMGLLVTFLSNIMNNLPSVMLGTIIITEMDLNLLTLQTSYIALIVGSDIGALLTPMGTLATLLWMFVLRKKGIHITWVQYFKVALLVIPITLIVTLLSLYLWITWIL